MRWGNCARRLLIGAITTGSLLWLTAAEAAADGPAAGAIVATVTAAPKTHIVQSGETLSKIGNRYGCAVHQLQEANKIEDPRRVRAGQRLVVPACRAALTQSHSIRSGETISEIAGRYGCDAAQLQKVNKIEDPRKVRVGQRLRLPSSCSNRGEAGAVEASSGDEDPSTLGKGWYRAQSGDTLSELAVMSGCSIKTIQRANKMDGTALREGQRLRIPDCGQGASSSGASRPLTARGAGTLKSVMERAGFSPPTKFKAMVTVINFDAKRHVSSRHRHEYDKTADDVYGWNPASTIKIYAAVAALLRVERKGFSRKASVKFFGAQKHETTVEALVEASLIKSDNIAHNRLVQLAGFDNLNSNFFSSRYGFEKSAISRAYETKKWVPLGEPVSFRETPKIVIRERGKRRTIPAMTGKTKPKCAGGACTSLRDLSEAMARIMLDQLPSSKRYDLSRPSRRWLQRILRAERKRGDEVVDRLFREFTKVSSGEVKIYHKAGFSQGWYSDVAYVFVGDRRQAYIVALAGYKGRDSLNEAATIIGKLLANKKIE
jgi:LysM repeat protein